MMETWFDGNFVSLWRNHHAWIIGFVLIALSSYARFNTPPTSRSSTTWDRYAPAALAYMVVTLVGWLVLSNTPDLLAWLAGQAEIDTEASHLAAPLYAALVLTVMVSSFKPFQKGDEKLRTFFHELARIPWEARRLRDALRARTWLPPAPLQEQVRTTLREAEFEEQDISFAGDRSPQALWTKITALHDHVHSWHRGERRRFAAFYYQSLTEWQKLSADYQALAGTARRIFRLLDTLQGDPKLAAVQKELIDGFVDGAERLEKAICDLVSRALLQCALTEKTRREALETMGFVVNIPADRTCDRLLLLYIILVVLYSGLFWVVKRPQPLLAGAIIATIYVGAVLAARYPKRWAWARPHEMGRPIRGYVLSGVLAFACSMGASFGLGILLTWDVQTAAQLLVERWWPWGWMAAFMAVATAYNMDNDERSTRRWVETLLQAAVGVVGALIVHPQLQGLCAQVPECPSPPPLVRMMLSAAVTGGVIGWFVPTWSRSPQALTVNYKGWKVKVIAKVLPNGHVIPAIQVSQSSKWNQREGAHVLRHDTTENQLASLPFEEEFPEAEEALAQAVEYVRKQIDGGRGAMDLYRRPWQPQPS
jgi:hypothetical protein